VYETEELIGYGGGGGSGVTFLIFKQTPPF